MYTKRKKLLVSTAAALLSVLVLGASGCAGKKLQTSLVPQAPTMTPASVDVLGGLAAFTIEPGKFRAFRFTVSPTMSKPALQGTFTATGGSGNDVEAFVMENAQYQNWQNGLNTANLYSSGRATAGKIDIQLPTDPDTYWVVFSNKFSYISNKAVQADLKLEFDHKS